MKFKDFLSRTVVTAMASSPAVMAFPADLAETSSGTAAASPAMVSTATVSTASAQSIHATTVTAASEQTVVEASAASIGTAMVAQPAITEALDTAATMAAEMLPMTLEGEEPSVSIHQVLPSVVPSVVSPVAASSTASVIDLYDFEGLEDDDEPIEAATITASSFASSFTMPADFTPIEPGFFDSEAAAASMQESAAELKDAAEEMLIDSEASHLEDDVDELIEIVAEGSRDFIEAWSYKKTVEKLTKLHWPIPSQILTTASRGMDIVIKGLGMMSHTAVHLMGEKAYAPCNVTIPFYIAKPLELAFMKPFQGLNYIMDYSAYAVDEINLKIRSTPFHKDPLADPSKGAYGVLTRAYNVLEAGQMFANISTNRTGMEWMPRMVEPVMCYARDIVVDLDGCVDKYPPLPPLPAPAAPPEAPFTWPHMPDLKDLVEQAEEVSRIFEEGEQKAKEMSDHIKDHLEGNHNHQGETTNDDTVHLEPLHPKPRPPKPGIPDPLGMDSIQIDPSDLITDPNDPNYVAIDDEE
ncbi:hypothetical protein SCUCBS95973_000678 [Sporothrix curviconia]|uniref:Uncharacterized protein n=1 Tax=Sporothrix curviconia TaxID=1260050 RepID=A0ABP0AS58_9PEZI